MRYGIVVGMFPVAAVGCGGSGGSGSSPAPTTSGINQEVRQVAHAQGPKGSPTRSA